jgi:hypothetical protein
VRDPQVLADGGDVLQLNSINDATQEGALLLAEARRVLELAGLPDAQAITLAQVQERMASLQALRFNGDGVVSAATAEGDEALAGLIARIQELYGAVDGTMACRESIAQGRGLLGRLQACRPGLPRRPSWAVICSRARWRWRLPGP